MQLLYLTVTVPDGPLLLQVEWVEPNQHFVESGAFFDRGVLDSEKKVEVSGGCGGGNDTR